MTFIEKGEPQENMSVVEHQQFIFGRYNFEIPQTIPNRIRF